MECVDWSTCDEAELLHSVQVETRNLVLEVWLIGEEFNWVLTDVYGRAHDHGSGCETEAHALLNGLQAVL